MSDSTKTATVFVVEFEFKGEPEAETRRLRSLLKYALRVFSFRCLNIREVQK